MVHQADRTTKDKRGAILLMTVFIIALGTILIIGFLELSISDLKIVRNHQYSTRALHIADAGIEDALYELGQNSNWDTGFTDKAFAGETYTVVVYNHYPNSTTVESTATVDGTYQKSIQAGSTVQGGNPPTMDYWKEI